MLNFEFRREGTLFWGTKYTYVVADCIFPFNKPKELWREIHLEDLRLASSGIDTTSSTHSHQSVLMRTYTHAYTHRENVIKTCFGKAFDEALKSYTSVDRRCTTFLHFRLHRYTPTAARHLFPHNKMITTISNALLCSHDHYTPK
jgi:hypothetical protein